MYWMISASEETYHHFDAFEVMDELDWKKGKRNFSVGDYVLMYACSPYQRLSHLCKVIAIDINYESKIPDEKFWSSAEASIKAKRELFIRLKKVKTLNSLKLDFENLNKNGLLRAPQGPQRIKEPLLSYVLAHLYDDNYHEEANIEIDNIESKCSDGELDKKSKNYPEIPKKRITSYLVYERNPYIVVQCLRIADGMCQHCGKKAPFKKKSNGDPYLEVHHVTPLSKGGKDVLSNLIALCPNCHREKHFG